MALDQIANEMSTVPIGRSMYRHLNPDGERLVFWTRHQVPDAGQIGEAAAAEGMETSTLGDLLRTYRKAAGLTQEDLAEDAKISVRGLSNLERGIIHTPRRYTIQALARALELSPEDENSLRAALRRSRSASPGISRTLPTPPPVQTVLIADILGYNPSVDELESDAGTGLAMRFAAWLVTKRRGGLVRVLNGDKLMVVFPSPRQALCAAIELQQKCCRIGEESLGLRVGLDAGELEVGDRGEYHGLALNLAARLCGAARASEALASQTVIHLAQKVSGVNYQDRGVMTFIGVPDPIRVFQVLPVLPNRQQIQATSESADLEAISLSSAGD